MIAMSLQLDHKSLGSTVPIGQGSNLPVPPPPKRPPSAWARAAGLLWMLFRTSAVVSMIGTVVLLGAERLAPYPWKPSTMVGAFGGNQESAHLLSAIAAKRAEVAMQAEEQARAQQEVVSLQAANERVGQAYAALYQRGVAMATAWAQAATQALLLDTQTRAAVLKEGRGDVSSSKDQLGFAADILQLFMGGPSYGDALRQSARADRDSVSDELIANYRKQSAAIAASLQDWGQGLPDPATVMAATVRPQDQTVRAAPRLPVPPSPVYERPVSGGGLAVSPGGSL